MRNPLKQAQATVDEIKSISNDAANTMELTAICLLACACISIVALGVSLMALEAVKNGQS